MIFLMSWEDFLARNPQIEREYTKVLGSKEYQFNPDPMDAFYHEITGHTGYWKHAPEYGERAWRIAGPKYSLIVWDEGNGWSHPIGVEIELEKFQYVKISS